MSSSFRDISSRENVLNKCSISSNKCKRNVLEKCSNGKKQKEISFMGYSYRSPKHDYDHGNHDYNHAYKVQDHDYDYENAERYFINVR